MNYIVVDLEFNQLRFGEPPEKNNVDFPMEILQFGAVKLDADFHEESRFDSLVKPAVYKALNQKVKRMTGIREEDLVSAENYPVVIEKFKEWIGKEDFVLCTWGSSDVHELQRNCSFYHLDLSWICSCMDVSRIFMDQTQSGFGRLHQAAEYFSIDKTLDFHTALNDAVYTAMILNRLDRIQDYITPAPSYMSRTEIMNILTQRETKYTSRCPVCGGPAKPQSEWLSSIKKKCATRVYHCSGCDQKFRVSLHLNKTVCHVIPASVLESTNQ